MDSETEYKNYPEGERLAMLEMRAAELEHMLGALEAGRPASDEDSPLGEGYEPFGAEASDASGEVLDSTFEEPARPLEDTPSWPGANGRTEILITRGRTNANRSRLTFVRAHWKAAAISGGAVLLLILVLIAVQPGAPAASWPASVTRMQSQVASACANPDVAAEPTQVNFACGKGTRQVLWVFALLTSGGNPGYSDPVTGRRGLEPITPAQGGDVAWSLNLHAPYSPADAADSIEVAARAVNNIVAGATLTSASGQPSVQGGLESSAANCRRYTGSGQLLSRPGYPALCAAPLTAGGGQALVTDIFRQWMTGTAAQTATDAGVLFANAGNPGNAQVQKILAGLPGSGA